MKHLFENLYNYNDENIYPFHMPGHKRNFSAVPFLNMDITEVPGFDNLNNPKGILKEFNERLSKLFGSDKSFFSVNGATSCIHTAIYSLCGDGGKIAVPANCHKSIYSALLISGASPVFMAPEFNETLSVYGKLSPQTVAETISKNPDLKAVLAVSPTYEGVTSDIYQISSICHEKNIPLIVDEAHGAHFFMSDFFPETALSQGADLVINGLHKTLPFPTQTAVLHAKGNLINYSTIRSLMSMMLSSSPSYLLMGAAEKALSFLESDISPTLAEYEKNLSDFREKCRSFKTLHLLEKEDFPENIFGYDKGKLIVMGKTTPISSEKLDKFLWENKIGTESCGLNYVILMTSLCDSKDGFERLFKVLEKADSMRFFSEKSYFKIPAPDLQLSMKKAFFSEKKQLLLDECINEISADFVTIYPPGIPILIPGIKITPAHINLIKRAIKKEIEILGLESFNKIKVISD